MRAPEFTQPMAAGAVPGAAVPGSLTWRAPAASQIVGHALPHLGVGDRVLLRALALFACRHVVAIHGVQHIRPARDPFILVANHSTRRESVLVPALVFLNRGGRLVHFLADWNFRLIPGVGLVYARAQTITVTRKSAKPRFLNVLKPLFRHALPPLEQARAHLEAGRSIGVFPEGRVNGDPSRLLRGRRGTARLSLETGAPVVPVGIRFPGNEPGRPISRDAVMELHIGAPLAPPGPAVAHASMSAVGEWHATIMTEIARLSGKAWTGAAQEANHD